jgi:hypothetical protein
VRAVQDAAKGNVGGASAQPPGMSEQGRENIEALESGLGA